MAAPTHTCPVCGKSASGSVAGTAGGGGCSYCLLQLGLGAGTSAAATAPGTWSRHLSTHGGEPRAARAGDFLRQGVLPEFGDYELESEIARGGMGVVYRARQKSLNRVVAVKMILAGQLATPESVQRFRNEAEAAARLHHPGIVPIYEIGEHETQHFFSMELIEGVSLAECIQDFRLDPTASATDRRQQEACIAELVARVARALDFAHQRGVLHRDLKPSNILIDEGGQPHLTDFGLAKLTGGGSTNLTVDNAVLGTPGYLAPEQAAGRSAITTAADVYGLGATLYELLTGKPPFVGATAFETMRMAIDRPPPAPRTVNPSIHRDLETIALRCLEQEPERRYRSAGSVAEELERFIRREPIHARPVSRAEHVWRWCQRNPGFATVACALAVAIVAGSSAAVWQWRRAQAANVTLTQNVSHLEWGEIDDMLLKGQSSRALARVAALLRRDPNDANAAAFAMSVLERRRFPVLAAPQIRHPSGNELSVARVSSDGRLIATASYDNTVRLWDAATSAEVAPPMTHDGPVYWAEFSPDGKALVTASDDKTVRRWDVATGGPIGDPVRHDEPVWSAAYDPTGRYLLTRTRTTTSIVDAATGAFLVGPLKLDTPVVACGFLARGSMFFDARSQAAENGIRVFELPTGKERLRFDAEMMYDAQVTDDLQRAVTVDHAGRAWVWDLNKVGARRELAHGNGKIARVFLAPGGERVATIGVNHFVRVWDVKAGTPVTAELPQAFVANGAAFIDDNRSLLTWGTDSLAQVWDATDGKPRLEPMRHANRVTYAEAVRAGGREAYLTTQSHLKARSAETKTGAAQLWQVHGLREPESRAAGVEPYAYDAARLSRDGKWLAIATSYDYDVWVVDASTGEVVSGPLKPGFDTWGLAFTPDRKRLVTTSQSGNVCVWSLPEGKLVAEPVNIQTVFQPLEMSEDGARFATGSVDGFVRLWDVATGKMAWEMRHGAEVNSVAFSPDGKLLASAGEDRVVKLWDVRTGSLVRELKGHQNEVMSVVFSPDGRRILTASPDFTARVWDTATGAQLLTLPHQGEVLDAVYSPDGRAVATASRDRTAMIWDAATGRPHARPLQHEKAVRNVQFSPDGRRLLTADLGGLRVWDVATGHPLTAPLNQIVQGGLSYQSSTLRPSFTPDGASVFHAAGSPEALLWHLPVPPAGAPTWFPELLEAVAGQRYAAGSERPELVPLGNYLQLERSLRASTATDYYATWVKQWLIDAPVATPRRGGEVQNLRNADKR